MSLHAAGAGAPPAPQGAALLGTDDLLPLVIYVLIRSRATSLPAEMAFLSDFLSAGRLHGKEGYALVSLQCACRIATELTWESGVVVPPTEGRPPPLPGSP